MIDYIGDLSRRDAELLREFAQQSDRILEFGVGASTQIFAAYGRGSVDAVDTEAVWITKTQQNIAALDVSTRPVTFYGYASFAPVGPYNLIFVDGANEFRLPFAVLAWPTLAIGGSILLHDTRRREPYGKAKTSDVQHVAALIERFSAEIDWVVLNQGNSNTTVIRKRAALVLEDYNKLEGRTPAQLGLE